jgi:hypothetical protein
MLGKQDHLTPTKGAPENDGSVPVASAFRDRDLRRSR